MIYRLYVEKRPRFATQAEALRKALRTFLNITSLEKLRIILRYDVEGLSDELFEQSKETVFAEPQVDIHSPSLTVDDDPRHTVFAVEYLPGQFDQRADSCEQCIQLIGRCERPRVRTATVYVLTGALSAVEIQKIKTYLINPVESREASLAPLDTLRLSSEAPSDVPVLSGFTSMPDSELPRFVQKMGLAMDVDDLRMLRNYFTEKHRDPTLTELRVVDTYWSDHCRHTTFQTRIDSVSFEHEAARKAWLRYNVLREEMGSRKPATLMDIATIAAKHLQRAGVVRDVDVSDEINACTVKVKVDVDGTDEDWLLLFKNETHNHPTEIEPFGGAATCIGGAIRDPLSGRSYVYQAMRITGAGDPRMTLAQTPQGKLPQRQIVTGAAAGYSSYGNQIGLATGLVDEIYHPGYVAKHMELGAVVGATPASHVRRLVPEAGDVVVLLGGRTGRDGCGGATGSSKSHNLGSLAQCGAEVQKGNAPEERKLQRLFRNSEAAPLIKRCNDFGAGGVSVAIGELADGLRIDLDAVPKKYDGLDSTEIAISESQERMAVVLAPSDVERFIALAHDENLEATIVATVTEEPRLTMYYKGVKAVDIDRTFLDTNGAPKHVSIEIEAPAPISGHVPENSAMQENSTTTATDASIAERFKSMLEDLNVCSKQGLSSRFDSTIGAGTVLMPFGGAWQKSPAQSMAALLPVEDGKTSTCSVMSYGFDPYLCEADPYSGAYLSVVHSLSKLSATGMDPFKAYLTFQEYFGRVGQDPKRWGKPLAALLGALDAQLDLGVAAIGGKDSMSGTFEHLDVPPTLVSFAVTTGPVGSVVSPEFKQAGSKLILLSPQRLGDGRPVPESFRQVVATALRLMTDGKVRSAWAPGRFGIAEALVKMSLGNHLGVCLDASWTEQRLFSQEIGALLLEVAPDVAAGDMVGVTTESWTLRSEPLGLSLDLREAQDWYDGVLASVYPETVAAPDGAPALSSGPWTFVRHAAKPVARPKVLIPVFPGTNCEYDSAKAFRDAGADTETFIVNNLSAVAVEDSARRFASALKQSQILFIPGGFSGGDEPDGSGKFIAAFLRNGIISDGIGDLLQKHDGLILGICNGFQALIKLGLVPYGEIRPMDDGCPTLTFNTIGRHQSSLVRTRICSVKSPWLMYHEVGDVTMLPISHGEGRFVCDPVLLDGLLAKGQVATQYVDQNGNASMNIETNPNGSVFAIEGLTSEDGRIFGRMAHAERTGPNLYRNTPFAYDDRMFRGAVDYFTK